MEKIWGGGMKLLLKNLGVGGTPMKIAFFYKMSEIFVLSEEKHFRCCHAGQEVAGIDRCYIATSEKYPQIVF